MPFSVIILKLIQSTSKRAYKVYIKKQGKRYILTFLFTRGSFKIKIQHVLQIFKRQGESNKPNYVNLNVIENHFYFVLVN